MTIAGYKILIVGGQVEDVRAFDSGVQGLDVSVDWVEPADLATQLRASNNLVVVLPLDKSGLGMAKQLRGHERTRRIPLLFVADSGSPPETQGQAFAFPSSGSLSRPIAPEVIRATVELLLNLRRTRRPVGGPAEEGKVHIATLGDHLPGVAIYQIVQDPNGGRRFTHISAGIERIFGISPAEVLDDPYTLYGLIVPEDLPRVIAAEIEAGRTHGVFDCQFRQRNRSGQVRWIRCRSACQPVGEAFIWDGLITDVTVERRQENELRKRERRFQRMGDSLPVLIWLAGPDKRCLWFNQRWLDFTGQTLNQAIGDGWTAAIHPDDQKLCTQTYSDACDARRPFAIEYRLRRRDGSHRWFLDNGVPLASSDDSFTGFIGACVDITERKQMEEALRDADRRREDYLAMLAHELRNPLAPLRNGLHLLSRRPDDPQLVTETRAMMARQVENMARIVDDLLEVSRVSRGKVALYRTRLDLSDVARTCTEDRRAVAEGAGLQLIFAAPSGPVWVDGDATRLSQVLDNLIQNAIKFTAKGGTIAVTAAAEGDAAQVSVRDTGMGIDREMLPHLFEIFTQADRSLDRSRGGLGLGLALVKGLMELHGGTVEARSDGPGKGSEFIVRLKKFREPAALTEIPASPSSIGRRARVLVVEDNHDSAESLRMLLDLTGYEVEVAYTGPAGVEAAGRFRPHVVVCDIGLPELDGYGVARALRKQPELTGVRLIAVSGYGRHEDIEKSQRAGFDKHLTKPVDPQDLLEQLVFKR